jgi:hypothetical protein
MENVKRKREVFSFPLQDSTKTIAYRCSMGATFAAMAIRMRLTSIDEFQLLTCLKYSLWGSQSARFAEWKTGDYLVVLVEKAIAAVAQVNGKAFASKKKVWENGLYPHRIPIKFLKLIPRQERPPILGPVRDEFMQTMGPQYGSVILNQLLVPEHLAALILKTVEPTADESIPVLERIDDCLAAAQAEQTSIEKLKGKVGRKPRSAKAAEQEAPLDSEFEGSPEDSAHSAAQSRLIALGKITGSNVWIAANDQNRKYKGMPLGHGCLQRLPQLGLSEQAIKRISLIDVIWIHKGVPRCAFEVETSTSIYSGLLRMSDLLAVVPAVKIDLFIVAPRDRLPKFKAEINRPTFQSIGLTEYCRFIATEDLEALLTKIGDLVGFVSPAVVQSIAITFEAASGVATA